jgi:hypothetical protein
VVVLRGAATAYEPLHVSPRRANSFRAASLSRARDMPVVRTSHRKFDDMAGTVSSLTVTHPPMKSVHATRTGQGARWRVVIDNRIAGDVPVAVEFDERVGAALW